MLEQILNEICIDLKLSLTDVVSDCRDTDFVYARYCYFIKANAAGYKFKEIGKAVKRDRVTVYSGIKKATDLKNDKKFKQFLEISNTKIL